jgi:hypothetical protein
MSLLTTIFVFTGIAVLAVLLWGRRQRTRASSVVLVLQKFKVDNSAPDGVFIEIEGRAAGLLGWILTHLGLSPTITFRVTATELHKQATTLYGQVHVVIPLKAVASTYAGYVKPFNILLFGLILGSGSLLSSAVLFGSDYKSAIIVIMFGLIVCGVCCFIYWYRRRLGLAVRTTGNETHEIVFDRGYIDNIPVDLENTLDAVGLLHRKIIEAQNSISNA